MKKTVAISTVLALFLLVLGSASPVAADGGVTFTDIASGGGAGVTYARTPSPSRLAARNNLLSQLPVPAPVFFTQLVPQYTMKPFGVPGVALLDYDSDGDLDIYVTNGPGTANSLYSSQLVETGSLTFVDVAVVAGVDATSQDSSGVCFGDVDNNGYPDLYVVSTGDPYQLFLNNGNGTFTDVTDAVTGQARHANGCTMADVNNDGLLDIVVANSYDDWNHRMFTLVGPTYPGMEHNFLFLNQGSGTFADVSSPAGIETVSNMAGPGLTGGALTWAIGAFDYDLDGDVDILCADNQGGAAQISSERRGWLRLFENDYLSSGLGNLTDVTVSAGLDVDGGWMGLAFGDFNCDGHLDFFGTNIGDYLGSNRRSSFYNGDGTSFSFGGPSLPNAFGWGTSPLDYDNDGDLDVVYHGSIERLNFISGDNSGVLIQNQGVCSGTYTYDVGAWTTDHSLRNVHGVASGDLNGDGFTDIVSVSAVNFVPDNFYLSFIPIGSPLDPLAMAQLVLANFPAQGGMTILNPNLVLNQGNLVVEINNAENGNNWVKVRTRGSVGTLADGSVNRDGIGAVVKFTPANGPSVSRPIVGGSSYASQDSLEIGFGLGSGNKGDLEILWPGGTRNSLRNVHKGETVLFPEIPCSFDAAVSFQDYHECVTAALDSLIGQGVIDGNMHGRFLSSAIDAYHENH